MKQFSAYIETLKESINLQLSNIEIQINNASLALRKDIMQLKQEINIIKQTSIVLEGNIASLRKKINTQSESSTILSVTLKKITCKSLVFHTPKMKTVKIPKTIMNGDLNNDISIDAAC